jgi:hypothetical protein
MRPRQPPVGFPKKLKSEDSGRKESGPLLQRPELEPKPLHMEYAFFALLAALSYSKGELAASCLFKHNNTLKFFDAPNDLKAFAVKIGDHAYIAFRGTLTTSKANWAMDFDIALTGSPWRHRGFQRAWESLRPKVAEWLLKHRPSIISLTGHSLGSAIATVAAYELAQAAVNNEGELSFCAAPEEDQFHSLWTIGEVVGFGGPRVGLGSFVRRYRELKVGPNTTLTLGDCTKRFVMMSDVVARIPPPVPYKHVVSKTRIDAQGQMSFDAFPWFVRSFFYSPRLPVNSDLPFVTSSLREPQSPFTGIPISMGLIDPKTPWWIKLLVVPYLSLIAGRAFLKDVSYHDCLRYYAALKQSYKRPPQLLLGLGQLRAEAQLRKAARIRMKSSLRNRLGRGQPSSQN